MSLTVKALDHLVQEVCYLDRMLLCCSGIPWLISKYKQYILMRERLLTDTQSLRTKLEKAIPDPSMRGAHCKLNPAFSSMESELPPPDVAGHHLPLDIPVPQRPVTVKLPCLTLTRPGVLSSTGREQESRTAPEGLNSNAVPTSSGGDVGARMRQALEYKRSKAANSASGMAPAALTEASAGAAAASVAAAASAPGRFADRRCSRSGIAGQASGRLSWTSWSSFCCHCLTSQTKPLMLKNKLIPFALRKSQSSSTSSNSCCCLILDVAI